MFKLFYKTGLLRSNITLSHETSVSTSPNRKILFLSLFWPKNPSIKSKIPANFLHNLCQIKQGEISKRELFRGCSRYWIACVRTLVFPLNKRYKLIPFVLRKYKRRLGTGLLLLKLNLFSSSRSQLSLTTRPHRR